LYFSTIKQKITHNTIYLFILFIAGLIYRSYPHLFLIPRWIIEEEQYAYSVVELVKTGTTMRVGFQPLLEQYVIYYFYLLTHINITTLLQYANPFFGALTIIPLYFLFKNFLTDKQSLIAVTLWAFTENAIYRSATFNSTEAFGFLLAVTALVLYLRKNYIGFVGFIIPSLYAHLLPAVFIIGVVSLDIFLKGTVKNKIIVIIFGICLILFLYSPFNPHQRMIYSITPNIFASQFNISNIFLYSIKIYFLVLLYLQEVYY
jgi:hypothetical protein